MKSDRKLYSGLLLIASCTVGLLIAEVTLRSFSPSYYYVWPPNLEAVFTPSPKLMPGVSGESRFFINESGFRGRSFSKEDRYRILTIGGSTTECLYLDQSEAWPHLVEELLNEELEGSPVWVGNAGRAGHNTRHHILQVEKLLDQYPSIDLVILLIGINDMHMRLTRDADFRPLSEEGPEDRQMLLRRAFLVQPGWDANYPFHKRTGIYRAMRNVKERFLERKPREEWEQYLIQDRTGSVYAKWRSHRQAAAHILDTLPDSSAALNEYTDNVRTIIDLAEKRNTQVMFMTQPSMWRSDLPQELADLLWIGGIGPYQQESGKDYYSIEALADAMEMYNSALLQVCRERTIRCVDLASLLPKDDTVFYDDVHFNESGARKTANILARYLIETGLFEP